MAVKKISVNLKASIFFFVIYIATYVIDFFTFKSVTLTSFFLCIGALLIFTLFLRKIKSVYYLGILIFTCLAQYLGGMLHLYTIIPTYDFILHLSSGILLVLLADYVYGLLMKKHEDASVPQVIRLLFNFFISIASAAIWEIWEYSGDTLLGLQSQGGLDDTMTDIIAGSIGAVIGVFLLRYILNKTQKRTDKG